MTASRWEHFTVEELQCTCCKVIPDTEEFDAFMQKAVAFRKACGFKWPVTSGYRCPAYNASLGTKGIGHTLGALDVNVFGRQARFIDKHAEEFEMTGIGAKQHGPRKSRFMHLDAGVNSAEHPRPWFWTYP